MPRANTSLFRELTRKEGEEFRLNATELSGRLHSGTITYESMSDLLRETNDAQYGIVSNYQADTNTWLRDATEAIPLVNRMSRNAPVLEANNTLLRCLSRLRPIDFAVDKKMGEQGIAIRNDLKECFRKLTEDVLAIAQGEDTPEKKQKAIHKKEKEFDTFLVQKLHQANLARGCESETEAEKLLFHYRNLSSVLSPARTMVTLTYDKTAQVLQRETQYPVTKKTSVQKEEVHKLEAIINYPKKDEKNSHTTQRLAMQEADSLFAELIAGDERALGAQARKTHLIGAKNAFIVKSELIPGVNLTEAIDTLHAVPADTLWLARMGSPAFVGRGESDEVVQKHTQENLEQVREAAAKLMGNEASPLQLHVTTLNTDSPLEDQHTIIKNVYEATATLGDKISYMPTNPDGTFRVLQIASGLNFNGEAPPRGNAPFQKATRLDSVSKVALAASNTQNTLSVLHCASGQDRTGTAVEKVTQMWLAKRYAEKGLNPVNIENMRAEGGNAAEINAHYIQGSPGMKTDSLANNFFGPKSTFSKRATAEMYLASADTNKSNPVEDVSFLSSPCELAVKEYQDALAAFEKMVKQKPQTEKGKDLLKKGKALLKQVKVIAGSEPQNIKSAELNDLIEVLKAANQAIKDVYSDDENSTKTKDNVEHLANIAKNVSGKPSSKWKKLGIGLLGLACAALVVIGVLAVIPTGGASLLAAAVGAVGLAVASDLNESTKEKGLAHSVSDFKHTIADMKKEDIQPGRQEEQQPEQPLLDGCNPHQGSF